jgi:CheY-like chemotaxis protein/HPt (histidine-containing phosphotransfer) domain-containing protein
MPAVLNPHPIDEARAATLRAGSESALGARTVRVLLVEDDRTNQLIAAARLKALGYLVDIASDGLEAMAAVEAQDYDVVLMDLMMPEMDGIETTRVIRALPGRAGTVPIIALTGNSGDCYVGACLEAGMNDFLSKPFTDAFLAAAIDRALAQRETALPVADTLPIDAAAPSRMPAAIAAHVDDADAKRVLEVADIFLNEAERRLAVMVALLIAGDAKALERAAHSLEGAASSFGFHRLAAIASEIGNATASATPAHFLALLNEASGALSIARG